MILNKKKSLDLINLYKFGIDYVNILCSLKFLKLWILRTKNFKHIFGA